MTGKQDFILQDFVIRLLPSNRVDSESDVGSATILRVEAEQEVDAVEVLYLLLAASLDVLP